MLVKTLSNQDDLGTETNVEFIVILLFIFLPLTFTVAGIALIVNAIQSISETKAKYRRKG